MVFDVTLFSGTTGDVLAGTPYNGDLTAIRPASSLTDLFPGIEDALHCATEGSRIAVAIPPGGVEAQTAASLDLASDESTIAVIDLRKVYLAKADGSNVYNTRSGLPTVVRAPDGRPGIIVPDGAAPTEPVVQTIKKGDGPEVTGDVPVRVHYTGVTWDDKSVLETTWDAEPKSVTLDKTAPPGFADALKGRRRVAGLVVVPARKGTAIQSVEHRLSIYVIDILGLDPKTAQ